VICLMRFRIEVATLNYGEGAIAGFDEAWHTDVTGEELGELFAEVTAVAGKLKAERATKDDLIRLDCGGNGGEAEKDAFDNVIPGFAAADLRDVAAVFLTDSASGGKIFPFLFDAMEGIELVARFEILVFFDNFVIADDAATDAGTKSEIEALLWAAASLGEGG